MSTTTRKPIRYKRTAQADQERTREIMAPVEALIEEQNKFESDPTVPSVAPPEYFEIIPAIAEAIEAGRTPSQAFWLLGYLRDLFRTFIHGMAFPRRGKDNENALIEIMVRVVGLKQGFDRRHARKTTPRAPLESIELLHKQGVSQNQISLIHGISVDAVLEELRSPGKYSGPNYVPPSMKELDAEEMVEETQPGSPDYDREVRVYAEQICRASRDQTWEDVRRELLSSPN